MEIKRVDNGIRITAGPGDTPQQVADALKTQLADNPGAWVTVTGEYDAFNANLNTDAAVRNERRVTLRGRRVVDFDWMAGIAEVRERIPPGMRHDGNGAGTFYIDIHKPFQDPNGRLHLVVHDA